MDIHSLIKRATANAESKGWHDDDLLMKHVIGLSESTRTDEAEHAWANTYAIAGLAGIASECFEAIEAIRRGEDYTEELADIALRLFGHCGERGIDLEAAIQAKMLINERRPYKHGKAL